MLSALGDAVEFDLAGCELLTDAIVKENAAAART